MQNAFEAKAEEAKDVIIQQLKQGIERELQR